MKLNNPYRFSNGQITIIEPDVLVFKYDSKKLISVDDIIDSRNLRKKLIGDIPYYPIIDMTEGFVNFSKEAKKWVAENDASSRIRILDILLISSWALRVEAKLYLKFFKPINSTFIACSKEEALDYIVSHRSGDSSP